MKLHTCQKSVAWWDAEPWQEFSNQPRYLPRVLNEWMNIISCHSFSKKVRQNAKSFPQRDFIDNYWSKVIPWLFRLLLKWDFLSWHLQRRSIPLLRGVCVAAPRPLVCVCWCVCCALQLIYRWRDWGRKLAWAAAHKSPSRAAEIWRH